MAIFISLIGTGISIMEAGILRDQQQLMTEEKAAAVWPFVATQTTISETELGLEVLFTMTNKGVGPALINGLNFSVGETNGSISDVIDAIQLKNNSMSIIPTLSKPLNKTVIAAGEKVEVFKLRLLKKASELPDPIFKGEIALQLSQMEDASSIVEQIVEEYCYCSIYGDCWNSDNQALEAEEACLGREMLRMAD